PKGSSPARGASSSPSKWIGSGRCCEHVSLVDKAVRLVDPVLRLLLVDRLIAERGRVQRGADLRRERVALCGQILDAAFDEVVGRVARGVRRDPRGGRLQ